MSAAAHTPARRRPDAAAWGMRAFVYAVLVFLLLPTLIIVPMSFSVKDYLEFPPTGFTLRWYAEYFADRRWRAATLLSLEIAVLTTFCTMIVGTMVTYVMVRGRVLFRGAFNLLLMGPIIVPHIAMAVGLYLFLKPIGLAGSVAGFVAAHTVLALPFFVFTVAASLSQIDPALEQAAMSCGCSRPRAFVNVTLPLIVPSVLSGGLFAFIISFDEPTIAFFLSGIRDRTLPRRMFENIEHGLTPELPAIATLLTLLSIAILAGVALLNLWASRHKTAATRE